MWPLTVGEATEACMSAYLSICFVEEEGDWSTIKKRQDDFYMKSVPFKVKDLGYAQLLLLVMANVWALNLSMQLSAMIGEVLLTTSSAH